MPQFPILARGRGASPAALGQPRIEGKIPQPEEEITEPTKTQQREAEKAEEIVSSSSSVEAPPSPTAADEEENSPKEPGRRAADFTALCVLCEDDVDLRGEENVLFLGPFTSDSQNSHAYAHSSCVKWTPGCSVDASGKVLNLQQILAKRSQKCSRCKSKGATLICHQPNCRQFFHYPCAVRSECAFVGSYKHLYCPAHASMAQDDNTKGDNIFQVEKILSERVYKKKVQYFIKWQGYTDKDSTWEDEDSIMDKTLILQWKTQRRKVKMPDSEEKSNEEPGQPQAKRPRASRELAALSAWKVKENGQPVTAELRGGRARRGEFEKFENETTEALEENPRGRQRSRHLAGSENPQTPEPALLPISTSSSLSSGRMKSRHSLGTPVVSIPSGPEEISDSEAANSEIVEVSPTHAESSRSLERAMPLIEMIKQQEREKGNLEFQRENRANNSELGKNRRPATRHVEETTVPVFMPAEQNGGALKGRPSDSNRPAEAGAPVASPAPSSSSTSPIGDGEFSTNPLDLLLSISASAPKLEVPEETIQQQPKYTNLAQSRKRKGSHAPTPAHLQPIYQPRIPPPQITPKPIVSYKPPPVVTQAAVIAPSYLLPPYAQGAPTAYGVEGPAMGFAGYPAEYGGNYYQPPTAYAPPPPPYSLPYSSAPSTSYTFSVPAPAETISGISITPSFPTEEDMRKSGYSEAQMRFVFSKQKELQQLHQQQIQQVQAFYHQQYQYQQFGQFGGPAAFQQENFQQPAYFINSQYNNGGFYGMPQEQAAFQYGRGVYSSQGPAVAQAAALPKTVKTLPAETPKLDSISSKESLPSSKKTSSPANSLKPVNIEHPQMNNSPDSGAPPRLPILDTMPSSALPVSSPASSPAPMAALIVNPHIEGIPEPLVVAPAE